MKRIVSLVIASSMMLFASPAAASDPPDGHPFIHGAPSWYTPVPDGYVWKSWYGGWIDQACATDAQEFKIDFYADEDYSGARVRICHGTTSGSSSTMCDVPLGDQGSWEASDACRKGSGLFGNVWGVANDRFHSFEIKQMGRNSCVRLFEHKDRDGRWITFDFDVPDLGAYHHPNQNFYWGDRVSSLKRQTGDACDNMYGSN